MDRKQAIKQIVKQIKRHENIAVFHHIKPDGDSLSSSYGLLLAIKRAYPNKKVVFVANRDYLKEHFTNVVFEESYFATSVDSSFLTIIGDTPSSSRVEYYEEFLKGGFKICFDHHQDEQKLEADLFWQEKDWSASAIQATMIARKLLGKDFDELTAFHLSAGIISDTNFFQYSLAKTLPLDTFSFLMKYVSNEFMNNHYNHIKSRTKEDIELTTFLLSQIQYSKKTSYLIADKKMIAKYGAFDIKQRVNLIGNIEGYPNWAMFIETDEKPGFKYEVSLRSNACNINEVAVKHNGGGHLKASGAKAVDLKEVKQIISELDVVGSKV